jgi:hypothetical protein
MVMRIVDAVLNAAVDAAVNLVDVGGVGSVQFYDLAPPATPTTAITTQTMLAEVPFDVTAFGVAAAGAAAAAGVPITVTGLAAGTIGWARVVDGGQTDADTLWDDTDVGTSGNNVLLNTLEVSIGVDFELTSYSFSAVPQT